MFGYAPDDFQELANVEYLLPSLAAAGIMIPADDHEETNAVPAVSLAPRQQWLVEIGAAGVRYAWAVEDTED